MSRLMVISKLWAEKRSSDCEGFLSRTAAPCSVKGVASKVSSFATCRGNIAVNFRESWTRPFFLCLCLCRGFHQWEQGPQSTSTRQSAVSSATLFNIEGSWYREFRQETVFCACVCPYAYVTSFFTCLSLCLCLCLVKPPFLQLYINTLRSISA